MNFHSSVLESNHLTAVRTTLAYITLLNLGNEVLELHANPSIETTT